ncbi:MAG: hypothetical protein JNL85_18405 [Rubrivivax sp.]|nr:hypothetical protein [Rubrivivax sp.]
MAKNPADSPRVDLGDFDGAPNDDARNRLLFAWLGDDGQRAALFERISGERGGVLEFPSRDAAQAQPCCPDDEHPRAPPPTGHKPAWLVTRRALVAEALLDGGKAFSNRTYGELGGGNFMLALDPATTGAAAHAAQVKALQHAFPRDLDTLCAVSHHACGAAASLSLRAANFDLAAFAEQTALRLCQYLFGYARADFPLLERALRASYHALVYQVFGRHFVTDPLALPAAKAAMGPLLARTAALIDAYAANDEDALVGTEAPGALALSGLVPVLARLAAFDAALNGEQRAVVAMGAVAGTVGNVQAAVCIAVRALFADREDAFRRARELALSEPRARPTNKRAEWQRLLAAALNRNPPIPFLPRVAVQPAFEGRVPQWGQLLLALGGGTAGSPTPEVEDPLVWGLLDEGGRHGCIGRVLAWPLLVETVRFVIGLPGLAERLDAVDASVIGLNKRWGFICESYPLTHRREKRVAQSSLNVAMRIKPPVKEHAARLREVIRAGAPRIDEALREARHVHFAWFEFIERDTVLVLHTVYDGDFSAYVQHFALKVGDLFDLLFESIEDAPPKPVAKFPDDFVALIRRYNRAPAMGYFFSAYPKSEAAQIMREEASRIRRDDEKGPA